MNEESEALFDVVYPQDIEAAEYVIREYPQAAAVLNSDANLLSRRHARLGPREFNLSLGLGKPRHEYEAFRAEIWRSEIEESDCPTRHQQIVRKPVTMDLVNAIYSDLDDGITAYGKLLLLIHQEMQKDSPYPPSHREMGRMSWLARELKRPSSASKVHVCAIGLLAEECQVAADRMGLTSGPFAAPTVITLVWKVFDAVSDKWFDLARDDRRSGVGTSRSVPHRFENSLGPHLPAANELQTLARTEFALLRRFLRQHGPYPTDDARALMEEDDDADFDGGDADGSNESTTTKRKPTLKNWAFGYDAAKQHWWLFHLKDGRWEKPGKVEIQGGLPDKLLRLFAENDGRLDRSAAKAWMKLREPLKTDHDCGKSVKQSLSRLRGAIKEVIAGAGCFDRANIDDPLPLTGDAWIAAVDVGYANPDDIGRLQFQRKQDL